MNEQWNLSADVLGMVLVTAILALVMGLSIEPLSKRLATVVSQSLASQSVCDGTLNKDAAALLCVLRR